ncbi:MAG: hypothetical protein DMG25_18275 [Acidobacteria bacterium]|nr:MAG: hypothetical protein DMG25_18275 [Acidobacteriota bacterium]PYV24243.1 MAG: hypothetical protein DMG27_13380 [Acidobacteriota bacterium]
MSLGPSKRAQQAGPSRPATDSPILPGAHCRDHNPRDFGKPLTGEKVGLWRYRIGEYRVICRIEDERQAVLVLRVAHR